MTRSWNAIGRLEAVDGENTKQTQFLGKPGPFNNLARRVGLGFRPCDSMSPRIATRHARMRTPRRGGVSHLAATVQRAVSLAELSDDFEPHNPRQLSGAATNCLRPRLSSWGGMDVPPLARPISGRSSPSPPTAGVAVVGQMVARGHRPQPPHQVRPQSSPPRSPCRVRRLTARSRSTVPLPCL